MHLLSPMLFVARSSPAEGTRDFVPVAAQGPAKVSLHFSMQCVYFLLSSALMPFLLH